MKGYVKNKSPMWRHTMKRNIGPGSTVELDELYQQYGEKHSIPEGVEFVEWLKHVKLRDNAIWEVVYEDGNKKKAQAQKAVEEKVEKKSEVRPLTRKELAIDDVTGWSVRKAREELPKLSSMNDLKLLKSALTQARQLANKDTLCMMLRKKIQDLELSGR